MPSKSNFQKQITAPGYAALVRLVKAELDGLEFLVKRKTVKSYWTVGKYIHEHILKNKERADYGKYVFERLAADVGRDSKTLLRIVQFYRAYPIVAGQRQLTWEHFKGLMTVKDIAERKKLEEKVVRNEWTTGKLWKYLRTKRELEAPPDENKPIPQLKFTRGKLNTFQVAEISENGNAVLDLGFRQQAEVKLEKGQRFTAGDCAKLTLGKDGRPRLKKVEAKKEELFAYPVEVKKVIDGDTLLVRISWWAGFSIEQKLRLRGIDCPEMDTDEGKAAKKFVEGRLKGAVVVIKTHKDTTDRYDRYLADVFYEPSAVSNQLSAKAFTEGWKLPPKADPPQVENADSFKFLNQELLDERMAVTY